MSDITQRAHSYLPDDKTLDFWVKHNLNVLMVGEAGVGKTAMIMEAFKRNGKKVRYFSAATMDPWVDFIGIPKEAHDANGPYLELVKPKEFRDDEVEAIFFDELNRAHKKVRNAVMELIQFKSINGKKFPNLKMIWAAINPKRENDPYDVEDLDPAQRDRFTVQIEIPYKPSKKYFVQKYGQDVGYDATAWWESLPDNVKQMVSPRRLDSAIEFMKLGGNVRHVLPPACNVEALIDTISKGAPSRRLKIMLDSESKTTEKDLKAFVNDITNFKALEKEISSNPTLISHLTDENLTSLFSTYPTPIGSYLESNFDAHKTLIENISTKSPKKSRIGKLATSIIKAKTKPRKTATIAIRKKAPLIDQNNYVINPKPAVVSTKTPGGFPAIYGYSDYEAVISLYNKKSAASITPHKLNIIKEFAYLSRANTKIIDKTQCDKIIGFLNYFAASSQSTSILLYGAEFTEMFARAFGTGYYTIDDLAKDFPFLYKAIDELRTTYGTSLPITRK